MALKAMSKNERLTKRGGERSNFCFVGHTIFAVLRLREALKGPWCAESAGFWGMNEITGDHRTFNKAGLVAAGITAAILIASFAGGEFLAALQGKVKTFKFWAFKHFSHLVKEIGSFDRIRTGKP